MTNLVTWQGTVPNPVGMEFRDEPTRVVRSTVVDVAAAEVMVDVEAEKETVAEEDAEDAADVEETITPATKGAMTYVAPLVRENLGLVHAEDERRLGVEDADAGEIMRPTTMLTRPILLGIAITSSKLRTEPEPTEPAPTHRETQPQEEKDSSELAFVCAIFTKPAFWGF